MAFQDRAESLAERLHLCRVPRPVFVAIAVALALLVGLAGFAFATASPGGFEVEAQAAAPREHTEEGREVVGASGDPEGADDFPAAQADNVALSTGSEADRRLCVHVDGCVAAPGVYYLAPGSRVIDAVSAAGGATEEARTEAVNLAQELQDGQQIVIPSRSDEVATGAAGTSSSEVQGSGGGAASGGLVNINTATAQELQTLRGIGEATAEKIIADREANGPFKSIDDLTRVSGIGEKKLAAIRDGLCL